MMIHQLHSRGFDHDSEHDVHYSKDDLNPDTDASQYTNVELTEILDPTTEKYRDYINYVYDDSQWSFCDGSESWFD